MLPTTIVRTGRSDALYDSFRSEIALMLHYQDWWAGANVSYVLISIMASVAIGITTVGVTDKRPVLKQINIALAFIIALSSGLNVAFRPAETAARYGSIATKLRDASSSFEEEHYALPGQNPDAEDRKLTSKYAKIFSDLINERNNIISDFGTKGPNPSQPK